MRSWWRERLCNRRLRRLSPTYDPWPLRAFDALMHWLIRVTK